MAFHVIDGRIDGGPSNDAASITPNDSADLDTPARAIWVGGAGDLNVDTLEGTTVVLVGAAAGTVIPLAVKRVRSTSTTATNLVALF